MMTQNINTFADMAHAMRKTAEELRFRLANRIEPENIELKKELQFRAEAWVNAAEMVERSAGFLKEREAK